MLIISNPNAGDKTGSQFLNEHVIPLLTRYAPASIPIEFKETGAPGDAGVLASRYIERIVQGSIQEQPVIVLSGGDTTIHEVVNGTAGIKQPASVIVVPSGTANALYHSLFPPNRRTSFIQRLPSPIREEVDAMNADVREKLYAVLAFLSGEELTKKLYSTRTKILDAKGEAFKEIVSCVVVSASLHASILEGAEALRSTHPGIERFKIAAAQSITQWSDAQLVVEQPYQVYDLQQGVFRTVEPEDADIAEFPGPFAYFLTTTNVDRLEKDFRITPLATSVPFTDDAGWMEVLMIRPQGRPSQYIGADEDSRKSFAMTTMKVLQAAYNDGSHVAKPQGDHQGQGVIEYLRVRGWQWLPVRSAAAAHLICVDGEILRIPPGGRAVVELLSKEDRPELSVYCES
ncbi:hypothetical protein M408DRAFT_73413 [Serendipita vermifera MAFF 305830]|uniref:DAGKc domain-containing protein n=1 Tax=Serendipita vermifera MAFF 305830 TaxID=933852 RepID=A0A0C3AN92_SERVB|nr:hypothetical protein M408DRAFT_73413 [Serendipita vermifera MAFF 305830]